MSTSVNAREHSLDGLRGLAAMGVVVSHFILLYHPVSLVGYFGASLVFPNTTFGWIAYAIGPFATVLFSGVFQVMVFFVLSGYVLVRPFWENRHGVLLERMLGRYLRLNIPVAAGTIFAFGLCSLGLMYNHIAAKALCSPWFDSFFNGNTLIPYNAAHAALYHCILFGSRAFDPPLWSIHYEFVGSIFVLGTYFLFGRACRWLPSLSVLALYWIAPNDRAYYGCFIFGAALGGVAPLRDRRLAMAFLILGLLLGSELTDQFMRSQMLFATSLGGTLFPRMLGAVFVVCAVRSGLGSPLFRNRVVQYLGSISYSIYILHFLVLASFVSCFQAITPPFHFKVIISATLYITLCVGMSHVFWRFVDVPSTQMARSFSSRTLNLLIRLHKGKPTPSLPTPHT